ncbi:MAG: ABC transporter permease subunit [Haloarculaceae archaeon]
MRHLRTVVWRVSALVGTVWAVFTLAFAYVAFTPFAGAGLTAEGAPASPGDSLAAQYVDWLTWLLTVWDEPVAGTILTHLSFTAAYFVPAFALAVGGATAARVYTVARERNTLDSVASALTLVAVSLPVFLVALWLRETFLVTYMEIFETPRLYDHGQGALAPHNLVAAAWPMAPMGLYLFAIQSRYAGDLLAEYATADFVKTARMKGAGTWAVGRHILRTNVIPLSTLFFTDMLGLVVVGVVAVEYVVGTPGIGQLTVEAVVSRDAPLVLTLSVLTVVVGVLANFLQDLAYLQFDPRVEFDR